MFYSLREAIVVIEGYRRIYRNQHPHSSLEYRTPGEFAATCGEGNSAPPGQGLPLRLAALASLQPPPGRWSRYSDNLSFRVAQEMPAGHG